LVALAVTWHFFLAHNPALRVGFVMLVGLSLLLDLLDGYLARKFGHTSHFGTLFDLLIDLITHTTVWFVSGFVLAPALIIIEWAGGLYMAAFALQPNNHWKGTLAKQGPALIQAYFSRNQRNALSILGNIGHFLFPMALYLGLTQFWVYLLTLPGLILYELVTVYLLYLFMKLLVKQ